MTMTPDDFWKTIEEAKEGSQGDRYKQIKLLDDTLMKMPVEDVLQYMWTFLGYKEFAYHRSGLKFAYHISNKCCEWDYVHFLTWLIAQGQKIFFDAILNPDNLAYYLDDVDKTWADEFSGLSLDMYIEKTRHDRIPEPSSDIILPIKIKVSSFDGMYISVDGDKFDIRAFYPYVKQKFPRLWTKFREPDALPA